MPTLNVSRPSCAKRRYRRYARMHLSARPSLLFSVALLVFGSEFCVAVFDRAGAQFSPMRDVWADTRLFVRVVKSLTCLLSDLELGHDPMVALVHGPLCQQQHRTVPERHGRASRPREVLSRRRCGTRWSISDAGAGGVGRGGCREGMGGRGVEL
ncbi:hypothetical protein BJ912DRAFT_980853, partial [Pholiota molesta]